MQKINFNEGWSYLRVGDDVYKEITIPHDAMIYENRTESSAGAKHTSWFEGHNYVYKKEFEPNKNDLGKKYVIEFEGVYKDAQVYLNDKLLYERPYGYTNFYVDLTDDLIIGEKNEIKVFVKNDDQPNSRWYSGSGIYRPVNLYILPEEHILINGIKIHTVDIDTRTINLNVKTNTKGKLKVKFFKDNKIIKEYETDTDGIYNEELELSGTKLWSIEEPELYYCEIDFNGSKEQVRFGIRSVDVSPENGFRLNGKRVILKGACIHHDNGLLGAVSHPFAERRKIEIMLESGYNSIRSAHNPCSKAMLDACDELGVLVLDEYVDMWYIHKNKFDYASHVEKWWKQDLKDMVDKDYNHPSVIMYSIGNEVAETGQKKGIKLTDDMTKYLQSLDNRPVTCGVNIFFNYLYSLGFGVYTDKKADKNHKKTKKTSAVGSEFFNNLAGILGDKTMKFGAWLPGSNRKTRDAFSKLDVAGYNYGIYRYKKDLKNYPNRVILGTETFCSDTNTFYELAKKNNALIGDFVWAGMDYLGEVGIGSWVYKDHAKDFKHGVGWMTAGSGRVDINGQLSGESSYTRVAYELDDIRIGVVPVNNYGKKHSPSAWKMSNALESWSFEGFEGKKTSVEVYTKAPIVGLYVNDRLIGLKKTKKDCIVRFKTKYYNGTITAVGFNKQKKELFRTSLSTALTETKLTLQPEQKEINLNDLAYVPIRYTDINNVIKPLIRAKVDIEVEGGTLIGLGHACPFSEHGYKEEQTDTYLGQAMAIIKPNQVGNIKIIAKSKYGITSATVRVK